MQPQPLHVHAPAYMALHASLQGPPYVPACLPAGVAGSATRAALTQHFAQRGNAADIAAKEQSQARANLLHAGCTLSCMKMHVTACECIPWRSAPLRQEEGMHSLVKGMHSHPPQFLSTLHIYKSCPVICHGSWQAGSSIASYLGMLSRAVLRITGCALTLYFALMK